MSGLPRHASAIRRSSPSAVCARTLASCHPLTDTPPIRDMDRRLRHDLLIRRLRRDKNSPPAPFPRSRPPMHRRSVTQHLPGRCGLRSRRSPRPHPGTKPLYNGMLPPSMVRSLADLWPEAKHVVVEYGGQFPEENVWEEAPNSRLMCVITLRRSRRSSPQTSAIARSDQPP